MSALDTHLGKGATDSLAKALVIDTLTPTVTSRKRDKAVVVSAVWAKDGKDVGHMSVDFFTKEECFFTDLFLDEEHQGQGVYTHLTEHFIGWCHDHGVKKVQVVVAKEGKVRDLYLNSGFEIEKEAEHGDTIAADTHPKTSRLRKYHAWKKGDAKKPTWRKT